MAPRNEDFNYQGLRVDHAGNWDPTKYKNYVDPDSLKRGYEGKQLPKAHPIEPKRKSKEKISKADIEFHSLQKTLKLNVLANCIQNT